mmetsp:Transcript_18937/g.40742  ORF Transcript_18937/g.40742 Transcript_18937/m.40742 type:complete len:307 (+) Transcript_18937:1297-2217(+)
MARLNVGRPIKPLLFVFMDDAFRNGRSQNEEEVGNEDNWWFVYRRGRLAPHNVVQVRVEEGTVTISHGSFAQRSRLQTLLLSKSLQHIEDSAFQLCSSLTEVYFRGCRNLLSIGHWAFMGVTLKQLDLSMAVSLRALGAAAFEDCVMLETVKLPSSLTYVGRATFRGCIRLCRVECSHAAREVVYDRACFGQCSSLYTIHIPAMALMAEHVFQDCQNLTTVTLKSTRRLREWSSDTFHRCSKLDTIQFGRSIVVTKLWPRLLRQLLSEEGFLADKGIRAMSHRRSIAFNFVRPLIPQYYETILVDQ